MTITATALTTGSDTTNQTTAYTTASVTPTANQPVLLSVLTTVGSGTTPTPVITGCGLTWTLLVSPVPGSRTTWIFLGIGASPTAGTISIAGDGSTTTTSCLWQVSQLAGVDISSANGVVQTTSDKSTSGSTSTSVAFGATVGAGNGTFGAVGISIQENPAVGSGWTSLGATNQSAPTSGLLAESGTAQQNITASWSTSANYFVAGVEMKAATGGPAAASAAGSITLAGTGTGSGAGTSQARATGSLTLSGTAAGVAPIPVIPMSPGASAPPPKRPVDVTILTSGYLPSIKVSDYASVSVTWQRLGVGTGTLVVGEDDPCAPVLLAADTTVVPVRVRVSGQTWTGRVITAALDLSQPPGSRQVTATLVDDWAWLRAMLASQNGSNPSLTGMPQYDVQAGPAATVAAHYINAAAARLGVPVAASPPPSDDTPSIGPINARMQTLADLLTDPLKAAGVVMPVTLWLPGDAQPYGLLSNLTRATLVYWPQSVTAKPWLRWSDTIGGIVGGTVTVNHAQAYRQVLGLQGDDAARVYDSYTDLGLQAEIGPYGFPESYVDATDIATAGTDSQARGLQKQNDDAPTVSASVTVTDGTPWTFGTDYVVGDLATLKVAGISFQQPITRVTATDNRDAGLVFTPQLGDETASASSDELIVRAVADIAVQLRLVQTGR